jgi:TrmH family RNA methyltransferase
VRSSPPRARPSTPPSASKRELARLRELLRDPSARDAQGVFVAEGPRVVAAALDHGAPIERLYIADDDDVLAERARRAGIPLVVVSHADAARIGDTRTPQPVFAIVAEQAAGLDEFDGATLMVVAVQMSDPGNLGTLMRSAAAAGAPVLGLGPGSVDAYNPKVVRASAGARFAIRTVEGVPAVEILERLGARGVRRIGTVPSGGRPPEGLDMRGATAIVLGHEAHGIADDLPLDDLTTIPMHRGESLNVAMAGTVVLFEAARQRRDATG